MFFLRLGREALQKHLLPHFFLSVCCGKKKGTNNGG
jgi:hypothetical protein